MMGVGVVCVDISELTEACLGGDSTDGFHLIVGPSKKSNVRVRRTVFVAKDTVVIEGVSQRRRVPQICLLRWPVCQVS